MIRQFTTALGCEVTLVPAEPHLGEGLMLTGRIPQPDGRWFELYLDPVSMLQLEEALYESWQRRCEQCNHTLEDHHEDGTDQPATACAVVTNGDRACMCKGFVSEREP